MKSNSDHLVGGDGGGVQAPQHEHDCNGCVFLGGYGVYDLYFHEGAKPVFTTLIARDGPREHYSSGLAFSLPYTSIDGTEQEPFPALAEARARAIAAGYGPAITKAEGGAA